jgi:hypothetical protein
MGYEVWGIMALGAGQMIGYAELVAMLLGCRYVLIYSRYLI